MQIARDIAGFPGPKADTLRAAIGKKKRADGDAEAGVHLGLQCERHLVRGGEPALGLMESAADYSFNAATPPATP